MHKSVEYINDSQNLYEALAAFLKVQTHMFIVVNNFGEIVGTLTLDKVLEQILGKLPESNFDAYENPEAVANIEQYQNVLQAAVEEAVENPENHTRNHPEGHD
jgi:Mg2+/Co2+ transporter CorB